MSARNKPIAASTYEEAANWLLRAEAGGLSSAEAAQFNAWLDASEDHRAAFGEAVSAAEAIEDVKSAPELIAMRGEALADLRRAQRARWLGRGFSSARRRLVLAGAAPGAAALGVIVFTQPERYDTRIGERRLVALDDGSSVSLDGARAVRVRYGEARRRLWLDRGRAKFDVAHDPLRPFMVEAGGRTIVATGTSFSVELINDQLRVVLYEGRVSVLEEGDSAPAQMIASARERDSELTPGNELIASTAAAPQIEPVDPVRSLAWEGGQLVFANEPLPIAVARMNRYASTPLQIEGDAARTARVSGVFRAGDTEAFVEGVSALLPLSVSRREGLIVLTGSGLAPSGSESVDSAD